MIFMRHIHEGLANAEWSSHPSDAHAQHAWRERKRLSPGKGEQVALEEQTEEDYMTTKLIGPYEKGNNGWRQLHAWVAEQELNLAPPLEELPASHLVAAMRDWQKLVGAELRERAFSVEAAEEVIAHVYRERLANWWVGAGVSAAWHSELLQDWWVAKLFEGMKGGFFVELATNDGVAGSNTYALERDYGWSGICIEPQARHWKGLLHRKCTVVAAVVSDVTGEEVTFNNRQGTGVAGVVSEDTANYEWMGCHALRGSNKSGSNRRGSLLGAEASECVTSRTVTLGKILRDFDAPRVIDYLSLDVEGAEHLVLQTFPFEEYRVLVITVERPDLCVRTILRQQGFLYLRDLVGCDEIWVSMLQFTRLTGANVQILTLCTNVPCLGAPHASPH
jgi:hypothetical protein